MLRVIATESVPLIEQIRAISVPEKIGSSSLADAYRKENTIFLLLKKPPSPEVVTWIASEFLPDRLYFPYFGYSVDMIHEVGDVIVPNVFLGYSQAIENEDLSKENRDNFIENTVFIENLSEQKDYYVEDFGLSLGGILVSGARENPPIDLHEKLMLAYEGDVYVPSDVFPALDALTSDEIPTMILAGIISGKKHSKYGDIDGVAVALKNIMTTLSLLEDEDMSTLEDDE